jgi:hypothetical protein
LVHPGIRRRLHFGIGIRLPSGRLAIRTSGGCLVRYRIPALVVGAALWKIGLQAPWNGLKFTRKKLAIFMTFS